MSSTVTRTHRIVIASVVILLLVGVMLARSSTAGAGMSFNEGLENIGTDGQTPTGWWRAGYGTNTVSWSFASQPHGGKIAQSVKISNWRSGDRKLLTDQSGSGLPVIPGRSYDLSSWYRTDGVATIVVYRRTTSGYWTYWTSGSRLVKVTSGEAA